MHALAESGSENDDIQFRHQEELVRNPRLQTTSVTILAYRPQTGNRSEDLLIPRASARKDGVNLSHRALKIQVRCGLRKYALISHGYAALAAP